jgi:peptidoglycan/LPS O-acetylase OafA/YrhL
MQIDSNLAFRADIHALRALAVIAVVVCHMKPAWLPGGYLGVDIFFVISGFVITQLLLNQQGRIRLGLFWLQRVFRIVPAYVIMLTVVATFAAVLFLPENFSQFGKSWLKSLYFLSNQYFASYGDYFSPILAEQPLLHTWSLAIEMQFYLVYPLLLMIVLWLRKPWLLLVTTVVGFVYAQFQWVQSSENFSLYYALIVRAPEFLLGGTLAAYSGKLKMPHALRCLFVVMGLSIMVFSLFWVNEQRFNPVTAGLVCLGAGLVIFGCVSRGAISSLYKLRGVLLVGTLSYSLYLWHWPVLAFLRYVYGDIAWTVFGALVYILSILCLAWLSWRFVETQFILKSVKSKLAISKKLLFMSAMALSPLAFAKSVNALVPDLPAEQNRYAVDKEICHGKILVNCTRGNRTSKKILMIGDSHAAQLNIAAEIAGKKLDLGIEVISASSCVPLSGFNFDKLPTWAQQPCINQINQASDALLQTEQVILAGMWSYQFEDKNFAQVLSNFFETAEARNVRVLVLGQIPVLQQNPRRVNRLHFWGYNTHAKLDEDRLDSNKKIESLVRQYPRVIYFDPSRTQMLSTPPYYKQQLIYLDKHHLNEVGSRLYGELLIGLISKGID